MAEMLSNTRPLSLIKLILFVRFSFGTFLFSKRKVRKNPQKPLAKPMRMCYDEKGEDGEGYAKQKEAVEPGRFLL